MLAVGQRETEELGLGEDDLEKKRTQVKSFRFISNVWTPLGKLRTKCYHLESHEMYETTSQNVFQYILLIQTRMGRWHQCQGWVFWVHRRRVPGKAN